MNIQHILVTSVFSITFITSQINAAEDPEAFMEQEMQAGGVIQNLQSQNLFERKLSLLRFYLEHRADVFTSPKLPRWSCRGINYAFEMVAQELHWPSEDLKGLIQELHNQQVLIDNVRDIRGNTLLHYVLNSEHPLVDLIEFLCNKGCDPNATNNDGETPLMVFAHLARRVDISKFESKRIDAIVNLLVGHGAPIDKHGNTLLHYAAHVGNYPLVECLIGKDLISTEVRNFENQTPLHTAAAR